MHISGKVFTWLTVLSAIAAMLLAAHTFEVRNGWAEQLAELKEQNDNNVAQIQEKSQKLKGLRAELARTMQGWDTYWEGAPVQVLNPQNGQIRAGFGTNHGFGFPQKPVPPEVYAFRTLPDGSSQYIGAFQPPQPGAIRENETELHPTWRLRPIDLQRIGQGQQQWRFRTMIPPRHVDRFSDLEIALTTADEHFEAKRQHIAIQQKLHQVAQQHLNFRLGELNGDPQMQAHEGKLPVEMVDGLLTALVQEEEARNAALKEVDRLRRELRETYQRLQQVRQANVELVGTLPQAGQQKSAVVRSR